MAVRMVGAAKNYAIWHFCLSESPGNKFSRQFARYLM